MASMTLSILDEKDMNTSFLSQTTYPDHDGLDSLPPSLVSSINSSYIVSTTPKTNENSFNSATFTHLEHSEKLLNARPRCQPFGFRKELKMSESYTKPPQPDDTFKVLNENTDKPPAKTSNILTDTVTIHFANNKFKSKDSEKENFNSTFETDDAFYKDMGMQKTVELGRESLNVTLDKKELNEIIQARQKLSLARKALPADPEIKNDMQTIQMPDQTVITVPRQAIDNASELLMRRRIDKEELRDTPRRNMTFKKVSPKPASMDTTVVYENNQMIDINSATLNLIDSGEKTFQNEVGHHYYIV